MIVPSWFPTRFWRSHEDRSPQRYDPGFVVPLGKPSRFSRVPRPHCDGGKQQRLWHVRLLTTPAERFERSIGRNLKRSEQTATPAKTSAASVSAAFALTDRVPPIQTARPKASNASIQKRNRGPRNSPLTSKSPYKQLPIVYPGSALSSKSSFLATIRDNTGKFILVSCLNHVTRYADAW